MKIFSAACLLVCASVTPAMSDTSPDKLHEIEHFFEDASIVSGPIIADCTLSRGTKTQCFSITVKATPKAYTPGPWCPTSINDDADKGGIWLNDNTMRKVDGAFIKNLAMLYNDDKWQLFNPSSGKVNVTDSKASCEAAARPDVDPAYNNYCVQCLPEYMSDDATMTYVIPLEPQRTWWWWTNRTNESGSGIAYNGIRLDGPAPVEDILAAHTIAPFDRCGGHVNTHVGYHYHAVTDCLSDAEVKSEHAAQIGIAMDGYKIFSHLLADQSAPTDLDKCNGHETAGQGYHYHAGEAGSNAILRCLRAEAGCVSDDPDRICDASAPRPRP